MLMNAIKSPMLKAISTALVLGMMAVSMPQTAAADDDHKEANYHPQFHDGRYYPNHGKPHHHNYSKRYENKRYSKKRYSRKRYYDRRYYGGRHYDRRHYRKHRYRHYNDHAAGVAIGLFALGAAAAIASSPRYHHPPRRHTYEYHGKPRNYGYRSYRGDPLTADN